jgi:hypothetical protein
MEVGVGTAGLWLEALRCVECRRWCRLDDLETKAWDGEVLCTPCFRGRVLARAGVTDAEPAGAG